MSTQNNDTMLGGALPWRDGDNVLVLDATILARHHKIVIDTDSLTNTHAFSVLCGNLLSALTATGQKAMISTRSARALHFGLTSKHKASMEEARRGIRVLETLQQNESVIQAHDPHLISGDPLDTELLLKELFIGYQQQHALCLVTQNSALAWAVLRNARSGAFNRVEPVVAAYVAYDGLRNWAPELANWPVPPSSGKSWTSEDLNHAMRDCKVLVDTCSWMLEDKTGSGTSTRGANFMLTVVKPLLEQFGNKLIVPDRTRLELEHHAKSMGEQQPLARVGLDALMQFRKEDLAVLASDPGEAAGSERFADPVFVRMAIRFQSEFDLCFITQDRKLATLLLESRQPGTGRKYFVTFIPMRGDLLIPWERKLQSLPAGHPAGRLTRFPSDVDSPESMAEVKDRKERFKKPNAYRNHAFRILTNLTQPNPAPLTLTETPKVGSTVIGKKSGALILIDKIAAGGEGTVYKTNRPSIVCKVYHAECLTLGRKEKLELMCSREVLIDGVCWPVELVDNVRNEFVGFLMPAATGKTLRTSVFAKLLLAQHFPQWSRVELTQLAITILGVIRELHSIGVLVGDVNPQNILVQSPSRVAIVDADSFQVEGYACPVGTETFTPPNRQGQSYTDFLRTHDDELYAVATLLFEILFPGKAPYSSQGGGDVSENIKNMRFPYGRDADGRPPVGPWQFIWSHLHPRLKENFTAVFARGERVHINEFIQHLEWSLREMHIGTRDCAIFPNRPWQREGQTVTMLCTACPPDKAVHEVSQALAERLRSEGKNFMCSSCAALKKMSRLQSTREVDCELKISPQCEGRTQASISRLEALRKDGKPYWCRHCLVLQKERWAAERLAQASVPKFFP